MRKNLVPPLTRGNNNRIYIENDWYPGGMPSNIALSPNVYFDTSYGFSAFHSQQETGLSIDEASGCYGIVSFITGIHATINVGKFCVLNGTTLISNQNITIGDHCMLAWGSIITDSWLNGSHYPLEIRRQLLTTSAHCPSRTYPFSKESYPVIIEDNCWVGFEAVILPGVRLGRGCVIGCKSVITADVPPYAVVSGNPGRVIKFLQSDDTALVQKQAFKDHIRK